MVGRKCGDARPYGLQRLLNGATWDADRVRDDLQAYVKEQLGHPDAVLVLDETGFLKKGRQSLGSSVSTVARRAALRTARSVCSSRMPARWDAPSWIAPSILPTGWTEDPARCAAAGVPEDVPFATKPQLARQMLARVREAGVRAAWVTADAVYGGDRRLRGWLEEQRQAFVLEIACNEPLWTWTVSGPGQVRADQLAAQLPANAWQRFSAGDGAKGPRYYN